LLTPKDSILSNELRPNHSLKLTESRARDFAARCGTIRKMATSPACIFYDDLAARRRQLSSGPLGRKIGITNNQRRIMMSNSNSTHRILFYLLLSVIIVTVKVLSQESPKDFKRLNTRHQMFGQSNELRQHNVKEYQSGKHSFADTLIRLPLLLKVKTQMKMKNNVFSSQSNMYVVDTAIVFNYDTLRNIYAYNKSGNIIEKLSQNSTNKQWSNNYRHTYTYNANGNQLSDLYEQWKNNQWVDSSRYTYTYDGNGNQLSDLYELWENNQWVNSYRSTSTYDVNGNLLLKLSERWTTNQWVNASRYTNTYDANGHHLSELIEMWTTNQWENDKRYTNTYDTNGNQLSYLFEIWTNAQWLNDYRYTYTYDANGNQLSDLYELWTINQWVNSDRYTYTYDANKNLLSKLYERWTNNQWVNSDRYTLTYDANGKQLSELRELWKDIQWLNFVRNTLTYDTNGNQLSSLFENWNLQWFNARRYTYKYFQNKLLSEGVYEEWQSYLWTPSIGYFYSSDNAGNSFSYAGYKISLSYKLIVTNVNKDDEMIAKEYSLSQNYPNPFNPTTSIEYTVPKESYIKIIVSDVLGRKIKTLVDEKKSVGSYTVQFDGNDLSSGMYFYQLQTKEFTQTKKLLLMK
jgi:hypothetical protein